jgi:hypothetical protein
MARDSLTDLLGDSDGEGPAKSPVAAAAKDALAEVAVAGPIGDALGLELTADISSVGVDPAGIGITADGRFRALEPVPGAPDLTGTVTWPDDTITGFGELTPSGQAYDVGVGASASSFNQLLAAETEVGLLNIDLTEMNGQPLTLKGLFDLVGAGDLVTEDMPIRVELRPEVAPVITTVPGPDGAFAEMINAGYQINIVGIADDGAESSLLRLVIDYRNGVNPVFASDGFKLSFTAPDEETFTATVLQNSLGLPDFLIELATMEIAPPLFAEVEQVLPSFPLPSFVGLDLEIVEFGRPGGNAVALYANLVPSS